MTARRRRRGRVGLLTVLAVALALAPLAWSGGPEYGGKDLDAWIEDLGRDYAPRVRQRAARALADVRGADARVVGALVAALGDDASVVRREAAISLGRIGSPAARPAVPALAGRVSDTYEDVAEAALGALASLGPDAAPAVPSIRRVLRHDRLGPSAIRALGAIGPGARAAIPDLSKIARGRDDALAALARDARERIEEP